MSITAFFAVCIISIDFMIYFFFKLLYAEKKGRVVQRRLPPEYYSDSSQPSRNNTFPTYGLSRQQRQARNPGRVITMPPRHDSPVINH